MLKYHISLFSIKHVDDILFPIKIVIIIDNHTFIIFIFIIFISNSFKIRYNFLNKLRITIATKRFPYNFILTFTIITFIITFIKIIFIIFNFRNITLIIRQRKYIKHILAF